MAQTKIAVIVLMATLCGLSAAAQTYDDLSTQVVGKIPEFVLSPYYFTADMVTGEVIETKVNTADKDIRQLLVDALKKASAAKLTEMNTKNGAQPGAQSGSQTAPQRHKREPEEDQFWEFYNAATQFLDQYDVSIKYLD
ncbi:unnamed protein product [Caenorhabditis angaria]|uniref:SXP/RAL-2 family protein Ani s 5-like cation-binding domain-containing protein n=1 Tax=Caenorhabditis angaria TaxID=860376 RepID=A0A9P1IBQ4_9PELO|nr:unnamed protein product [Caenorhabditis angaria]